MLQGKVVAHQASAEDPALPWQGVTGWRLSQWSGVSGVPRTGLRCREGCQAGGRLGDSGAASVLPTHPSLVGHSGLGCASCPGTDAARNCSRRPPRTWHVDHLSLVLISRRRGHQPGPAQCGGRHRAVAGTSAPSTRGVRTRGVRCLRASLHWQATRHACSLWGFTVITQATDDALS